MSFPCNSQLTVNFPTPVVTRHYGGAGVRAFNDALAALILELEAAERAGKTHTSIQGGYHTDPDFLDRDHALIRTYRQQILLPGIQDYLTQYYMLMGVRPPDLTLDSLSMKAWANVMRKGEWNEPHNHITAHNRISAVYYVRMPDCAYPEGALQFDNPNMISTLHGNYGVAKFQPVAGDLVLFPCYQMHYSRPFSADGERILIANDIRVPDQFDTLDDNTVLEIAIHSNREGLE